MTEIGQRNAFQNETHVDIKTATKILCDKYNQSWEENVTNVPKLRTLVKYKNEYCTEPYVYKIFDRGQRSIISQFRSGILPLSIETGRYMNIPQEFRLCIFCEENSVEDEEHFLFHCNFYQTYRDILFQKTMASCNTFLNLDNKDKLKILMNECCVKDTAIYLFNAYYKRRNALYK